MFIFFLLLFERGYYIYIYILYVVLLDDKNTHTHTRSFPEYLTSSFVIATYISNVFPAPNPTVSYLYYILLYAERLPVYAHAKEHHMDVVGPFVVAKENEKKIKKTNQLKKETGNKIPLIFSLAQTVFFHFYLLLLLFLTFFFYPEFRKRNAAAAARKTFLNYSRPRVPYILPSGLIFLFLRVFFYPPCTHLQYECTRRYIGTMIIL